MTRVNIHEHFNRFCGWRGDLDRSLAINEETKTKGWRGDIVMIYLGRIRLMKKQKKKDGGGIIAMI